MRNIKQRAKDSKYTSKDWKNATKVIRKTKREYQKKNKAFEKFNKNYLLIAVGILSVIAIFNKLKSGEDLDDISGTYLATDTIDSGGLYKGTDDKSILKNKIIQEAIRQGVDPNKALAIADWETRGKFNPNAYNSNSQAAGIFQVTPIAAKEVGVDYNKMRSDVDLQIQAGVAYLKKMLNQFGGDFEKAAAAYNWGPGNVSMKGLSRAPLETREYIKGTAREYEKYKSERMISKPDFTSNLYDKAKGEFAGKKVLSGFGYRKRPNRKASSEHTGIDLDYRYEPIYSFTTGEVIYTGTLGNYGKTIIIKDLNGYKHLYAHLSQIKVSRGQKVKQGDEIAISGNTGNTTGPHLHYSITKPGHRITGQLSDFMDPRTFHYKDYGTSNNVNLSKAIDNIQENEKFASVNEQDNNENERIAVSPSNNIIELYNPSSNMVIAPSILDSNKLYQTTQDNYKRIV